MDAIVTAARQRFFVDQTKFWGYVYGSMGDQMAINKKYYDLSGTPSGLGKPAFPALVGQLATGLGIDCSHFVQQSELQAGYNVPILSAEQMGTIVTNNDNPYYTSVTADSKAPANILQPGDVLVFKPKQLTYTDSLGVVHDIPWHVVILTSVDNNPKTGYLEGTFIGAQGRATGLQQEVKFSADPTSSDYWGGVTTGSDHHSFVGVTPFKLKGSA